MTDKNKIYSLFYVIFLFAFTLNATLYKNLSSLEKNIVDEGLSLYNLTPDNDPYDKLVRKIYIMVSSPFSANSGFLTSLNNLHVNTKDHIIRQEIVQKEKQLFDPVAVHDSEMILSAYSLVRSMAVIVPVRSDVLKNDEVDLLVVTRDLLSLRPSFSFQGSFDNVTNLRIALGENNLLGYNKSIAAMYERTQSSHMVSAQYFDPHIFGSHLQFKLKPSLIFARETFAFDGMLGDMQIHRPLLSQSDRFGYGLEISYGSQPIVDFNGDKVRTYEIKTTDGIESFERRYRWRYGIAQLSGRYSIGDTYKREFFAGYGLHIKKPSIPDELQLDSKSKEAFKKNVLPRDEIESFFTLGFSYFHNQFLTLYDYDNFKLQETIRIGPSFTLSNDFASQTILFSDHNFVRPKMKITFSQPLGDDSFMHFFISTSNRYDGEFKDNIYKYGLSFVSPKIFNLGRFILESRLSTLYDDRDNQKFVLGSNSGVRGVQARRYLGTKGFRSNVEFRLSPLDLWIFHAGLVLFYDVGTAFDEWSKANATHAVGFGFRFLAPQVSSVLFRIDFGFPVYGLGVHEHVVVPSFGTGQAF